MSGRWVFGYGSLVSPASFGHTLGRTLTVGRDFHEAEVAGYGRRWNYGVRSATGETTDSDGTVREWTIVVLGVVESADETVNGVVAWVGDDEIEALDRRERNYDRVDVTHLAAVRHGVSLSGPIETYVPRPEPLQRYRDAYAAGTAAIEERYWNLVDDAFAELGVDRRDRYRATTPVPDIPVLAMRRDQVPERYQVRRTE